jgi:hypothetical protein
MHTGLEASFERGVDQEFAFLVDQGFTRSATTRDPKTGLTTVAFLGRHIGVECVLDAREHEVDCKISRLVKGALPQEYALNARGERVREGLLHWFYRRGLRYIDFTPPSLPFAERMLAILRDHARMLREHGQPVLEDNPRALD